MGLVSFQIKKVSAILTFVSLFQITYANPFLFPVASLNPNLVENYLEVVINQMWSELYHNIKQSNFSKDCEETTNLMNTEISNLSSVFNIENGK